MSGTQPDVSVIVVVHNDREHLAAAVESVLAQSHPGIEAVIVDDCSDDGSFELAQRFVAEDSRVRAFRTAANSGAAGTPRNIGIRNARAPWVTFLDSDDLLDDHAAERLLKAAREDDADIVFGQTRRLYVDTGRVTMWRAPLYEVRRHLASISDFVDLVTDTAVGGKLYRRAFLNDQGLAFPEAMHYEDLVFAAQAYSRATSISIVPDAVYVWNVYPSHVRKSITHQRDEESNLDDRLAAIRVIEEAVSAPGLERVRERYQQKFVQHDAQLYLRDLVDASDDHATRVLHRLKPLLANTPLSVYRELNIYERLVCAAALVGSVEGVREMTRTITARVTLEGQLRADEGALLWQPGESPVEVPPAGSLERALLDVSGDEILCLGTAEVVFGHRAMVAETAGRSAVRVGGRTADPMGRIPADVDAVQVWAHVAPRGAGRVVRFPVALTRLGEQRAAWEFVLEAPPRVGLVPPRYFDVSIEMTIDGVTNASPVFFDLAETPDDLVSRAGTVGAFLGRRFRVYETRTAGRLAIELVPASGWWGRVERALRALAGFARSPSSR